MWIRFLNFIPYSSNLDLWIWLSRCICQSLIPIISILHTSHHVIILSGSIGCSVGLDICFKLIWILINLHFSNNTSWFFYSFRIFFLYLTNKHLLQIQSLLLICSFESFGKYVHQQKMLLSQVNLSPHSEQIFFITLIFSEF